ncbi:MAG: L-threonine 3-dehydrogenase [Anaerolineae bacterium]
MPETMRAVIKPQAAPGLEMVEVDVPRISDKEVLIRVKACSICGTDVHIYKWDAWSQHRIKPPLIIGHEFCGEIVEVGADVKGFRVGDYVSSDSHIPDGTCPVCRQGMPHICANLEILGVDRTGCFADYIALPTISLWRNDPSLDPASASIQDPMGNAVYTVLAEPVAGKTVAVFGDGPIGLGAVGVARAAGASTVFHVGKYPRRLEIGQQMGADVSLNITQPGVDVVGTILKATDGWGVDVVLEMTGNQRAINEGFAVLRKGGRFSAFGIPSEPVQIDLNEAVIFKGARILGINGRLLWETWFQMAGLLKSGQLDFSPIITHRLPFDRWQEGFEAMMSPEREAAKVVLFPEEHSRCPIP